ncbi:YncE family protein [Mycolicibacterium psychrotolerans]|uniref:YncE family protein n=1 Tax=Mycolicibacterium psychrotolerans TaxID=216929 RepID=UPI003D66DBCE
MQRFTQEAINALVPVINNTPIRNLLNIVDPPSGPGATVLRLPQHPVSMVYSADGTRAFVLTAPPGSGGLIGPYYPPSFGVVTEINTKNQTVVGVPVIVEGTPNGIYYNSPDPIVVSEDGTRAFVTTSSGVTVLDTAHCTVVGTPISVGGSFTLVPGTTKGYLIGSGSDSTGQATTTITPIDGSDGTVAGDALVLEGVPAGAIAYSPDGKRAYFTTAAGATAVTIVDTVGDTTVGQPMVLDGYPIGGLVLSPDGTRASQTTVLGDDTIVTVIDPVGGAIVGQPVAIQGTPVLESPTGSDGIGVMFSANGTRINRIVQRDTSTVLTVIDASDATIVGIPVVLPGKRYLSTTAVVPDPTGSAVYVLADNEVPYGVPATSVAAVVDSSNSTLVGTPVTLQGSPVSDNPLAVSPDGTHVYQTTVLSSVTLPYTAFVYTVSVESTLVGTPVTITDIGNYGTLPPVVKPDGSHVYQATQNVRYKPSVTVIDAATGSTVKSPFTRPALAQGLTFAPGGAHAYALTGIYGGWPTPFSTHLAVFNASKI